MAGVLVVILVGCMSECVEDRCGGRDVVSGWPGNLGGSSRLVAGSAVCSTRGADRSPTAVARL